jgi:ketosteroid isomerase-like protein
MAALVLCSTIGCQSRAIQDAKAARIAIDRANSGLVRWTASGDVDSIATLYADSAWLFPIGAPPVIGRKSVRGYWSRTLGWGQWQYAIAADTVDVHDDIAIERGHYSVIFTAGRAAPAGVLSASDHGHYLTYWQQGEDKAWRVVWTAPVSEVPPMVDVKTQ